MTAVTDAATIPFATIVLALREAGMEISVKDILQGIETLETIKRPFDYLSPVTAETGLSFSCDRQRLAKRDQLIWLVQMLWARTENEREIVRRILERKIAPAPGMYCLQLRGVEGSAPETSLQSVRAPSDDLLKDLTDTDEDDAMQEEDAHENLDTDARIDGSKRDKVGLNVSLPAIEDETLEDAAPYELDDVPMLDELSLASIWRRFRQPTLKIDHDRPDIERSINATIRAGGLLTIVPARRRVNQARLIVLFDVGVGMSPWIAMRHQFEETLDVRASRLREVAFYYFSGCPDASVFSDPALRVPKSLDRILPDWIGGPMLVFGEAGAARAPGPNLIAKLSSFLSMTRRHDIRPVVWINPMPERRWQPEFRRNIDREAHAKAFPLSHEDLIAAITVMREQAK